MDSYYGLPIAVKLFLSAGGSDCSRTNAERSSPRVLFKPVRALAARAPRGPWRG